MNNKCASILKLTLSCILGLTFLVGCGVDNKTLPKITSLDYQMSEGRIVVNASDDVKVTGYLLTYSSDEPKIDDESWIESGIFYEFKVGNAKVWVKDADGNLSYSEILIEDPVVLLAKEYEFLAWHLDDSTTKTVDGVTYDLTSLKQEYGDLYRFVEPLSKEEVEYRFQYLAEFFAEQAESGIYESATGGIIIDNSELNALFAKKVKPYNELMFKNEIDENFSVFSKYYEYLEKTGSYNEVHPKSMYYNDEFYYETIINVADKVPFDDKNWFVRKYLAKLDALIRSHEELQIKPKFELALSGENK